MNTVIANLIVIRFYAHSKEHLKHCNKSIRNRNFIYLYNQSLTFLVSHCPKANDIHRMMHVKNSFSEID